MDIVIVAQYLGDLEHLETTNGRFIYLSGMLTEENEVEIVTTTFLHSLKRQAEVVPDFFGGCKITALYEPGYPKNVCLKRLISHYILAKNIKKYLRQRKKPDVIYAAVPSLSVVYEVAKYCQSNKVRFIVDVQDLWPETFKMVFNIPLVSNAVFYPMKRRAEQIYALADKIAAVSQTYADRAMKVNKKCKDASVVYLGTDKKIFDKYALPRLQSDTADELKVAYVGSLSRGYDIVGVIKAMEQVKSQRPLRLVVMGEGELRQLLEEYAQACGIAYIFTGNLSYPQMAECLSGCDIAVNPVCKGSAVNIINKVGDYAMAGLPVLNTQESQEYQNLIEEYHAGINCKCEDVNDIAKALQSLINNETLRKQMADNSRRLGIDKFDRGTNYQKLVDCILRENTPEMGIVRLVYVGTLGHSYDISVVLSALRKLSDDAIKNVQFIVMGDGPKRKQFEHEAIGLPVTFTGMVTYAEMVWLLCHCDIAVNPIKKGAAQSMINKHMDYAMAGLPVLNTQENKEYRSLIDSYQMGLNCKNSDAGDLAEKMRYLIQDSNLRKTMGNNARRCAEERFDRGKSYKILASLILKDL